MLSPKKYKWRKVQRGKNRGNAHTGNKVSFGDFGLYALSHGFLNNREIEAARISVNRELKREGDLWIRVFPHKPITKRPAETRMGKGKGDVDHYTAVVEPGRMILEIGGVSRDKAFNALRKAGFKFSVKTKFAERSKI